MEVHRNHERRCHACKSQHPEPSEHRRQSQAGRRRRQARRARREGYLNEGRELSEMQRATLEDIKEELRMLYNREDEGMMSPAG